MAFRIFIHVVCQKTAVAALAASLLLVGCTDFLGSNDSETTTLSLSISIPVGAQSAAGKGASGFAGLVLSDSTNTLDIMSLGIVLREIELERQDHSDCDAIENDSDDDACEEFEAGPILLAPALDGSLVHVVEIDIPAGVYDELEFDIHKVGDDSQAERDFIALNPDYEGISIRVEGTYNDSSFVFTQDLDEEQEIEFADPIIIDENAGPNNITIHMDLTSWFRTPEGMLVDPAAANRGGEFEGLVEENIKRSIDAFEDDDHDGHDDDHEDDHDDDHDGDS